MKPNGNSTVGTFATAFRFCRITDRLAGTEVRIRRAVCMFLTYHVQLFCQTHIQDTYLPQSPTYCCEHDLLRGHHCRYCCRCPSHPCCRPSCSRSRQWRLSNSPNEWNERKSASVFVFTSNLWVIIKQYCKDELCGCVRVLGNFYALSLMSCLADGFVRSARSLIGGCLVPCILEFEGDIISRACRPSLKTVLVTDRRHCQDESESRERERESLLDLYSS